MHEWITQATLPWNEPLDHARRFAQQDMALLYSGLHEPFSGRYSYLFLDPIETIAGDAWAALPALPDAGDGLPQWVGWLGYGLGETSESQLKSPITLSDFSLTRYRQLWRFDHDEASLTHYIARGHTPMAASTTRPPAPDAAVVDIASNMTRAQYERIVSDTVARIHAGDFYQANITRKFHGKFADSADSADSFSLFERLTTASPAPYSAYMRHRQRAILSSSPECFLSIDAHGTITTRPIKGSARRSDDETRDATIRHGLRTSEKNHAENLMIVDLMRNDLARVSMPQSVEVVEQSALYSYRTIHHLISTIRAHKRADANAYDVVRACFPPGSMTGAPKIAAMAWCAKMEPHRRGLYSGAIGWFGAGNICDLSVVIRTLIIEDDRFEFQVGGGIVADSTPAEEWRETLTKARGILAALGLHEDDLAAL